MNVLRSRAALAIIAADAAVVAAMLNLLPLWLDELLQLAGTRPAASLDEVIAYVPRNPGGVPLGYLVQHFVLHFTGLSNWGARLPAAVFGVATCAVAAILAGQLGLRRPWIAAAMLAVLPLTLRYSTEARPYSQALFLSVTSVVLFLRAAEHLTAGRVAVYTVVLLASAYTQPFTLLTAAAAFGWALLMKRWRLAAWSGAALAIAAAALVPWVVYARVAWNATIATSEFQFVWTARTPLMLFREMSGSGYVGSVVLVVLGVYGLLSTAISRDSKLLLSLLAAVPVAGGLIADAAFGYFIAVRQFLWVLPPLAILAAAGLETGRRSTLLLVAVLVVASVSKNWRYFTEPKEDWTVAVRAIHSEMGNGGTCFVSAPADAAVVYEFLDPALKAAACRDALWPDRVVAAITPHTKPDEAKRLFGETGRRGFTLAHETAAGGTRVIVLVRRG